MTKKQQIEFAIKKWMGVGHSKEKKLVLLWSEDIPALADIILKELENEIKFKVNNKSITFKGRR